MSLLYSWWYSTYSDRLFCFTLLMTNITSGKFANFETLGFPTAIMYNFFPCCLASSLSLSTATRYFETPNVPTTTPNVLASLIRSMTCIRFIRNLLFWTLYCSSFFTPAGSYQYRSLPVTIQRISFTENWHTHYKLTSGILNDLERDFIHNKHFSTTTGWFLTAKHNYMSQISNTSK